MTTAGGRNSRVSGRSSSSLRSCLVGAATAVALAMTLSGCGEETPASAEPEGPILTTPGTLTVCSDMPYAPFESVEGGKPVGFDIDLVTLIAKNLKLKLKVIDTEFDDIQSGKVLNTGACDLVVSALTITGDRARSVDFSSPYFNASQVLVAPRGSGIESLKSMAGRKIAVQGGTTGELYLTDHAPADATIVSLPDATAMNKQLKDGRVDAAFYDDTIVGPFLAKNEDMEVAAQVDTGEQYGMAVRKDGNQALLLSVNNVLSDFQGKQYDALHAKWFR